MDEQHTHEEGTVYYGINSFLKFKAVDQFQNIIHQLEHQRYDVEIRYSEYNVSQNVGWKMSESRVCAIFLPDIIGEKHMVVQLVDRGLNQASPCTCQIPVKVFYPPCSPSLTLKVLDNNDLEQCCTVGKEFTFKVKLLDIFGNPVHQDSNEQYDIIVQAPVPTRVVKQQHQKEHVNTRKINPPKSFAVTLGFKIAGPRKVRVTMNCGSKSSFKDIYVQVLPSVPHHLNDVRFITNGAIDESFVPDPTVMYRNQWSTLEGRLVDCYDNVVELSDHYTVSLQLTDKGKETEVESKDLEIVNKTFRVRVRINQAGKHNLVMTLTNLNLPDEVIRLKDTQIQVNDAPLYLAGSQFRYPDTCVAGNDLQVEVLPLDVFGRTLPANSTTNCDLAGNILDSRMKPSRNKKTDCKLTKKRPVQTPLSKSATTGHTKEQVNIKKNKKPEKLSFAVTLRFTIAGIRKARLVINSGSMSSSKDISVQVCPSAPHHLHNVRFTTSGAVDESFSEVPSVIYRNQWSLLEATILDSYDNVVHQLSGDFSISLQLGSDKGEELEMESKNAEIRNEQFRVQVRTNVAGEHNLLITLTSGSSPDQVYPLKDVKIQVNEAPLYLLGSEFHCPEKCVAGKEIRFKIFPVDVFGFRIPADSSAGRITLTGNILNSPSEESKNKETIDFTIIKEESNIVICVTVVLTKAGKREVLILDKDDNQKELRIHANPDENDVHWEFTAPKETAYRREKLILTARLVDRFNNDVQDNALKSTPDLTQKEGPDGLHYVGKSVENNKVVIRCYFKQTGKYDVCLVNSNRTDIEGSSFSVRVQDAPLDYNRSTIDWIPQYDDIPDQPVFPDDEIFKCCLSLTDVVGYDYDGVIEMDCIEVRYGNTEVKNIKASPCANDVGSYNIVIPLKNLVKDDPSPQFWCFVNGKKIKNPLILNKFEMFDKYDDDWNCVVNHKRYEFVKIICRDVRKNDIIGSDYCHLNNVKRVCYLCDDPNIRTFQIESIDDNLVEYINDESVSEGDQDSDYDDSDYYGYHEHYDQGSDDDNDNDDDLPCTVITLPFEEIVCREEMGWIVICHREEIESKIREFRDILLHLLRATYYREQAFELDKDRETWKERASKNYRRIKEGESIDKDCPRVCSQIKEKYAVLMQRYHNAACEEFFQFFNAERGESEIDLHGLLVVDEKKLRDYERQLCFRGRMSLDEVNQKIKKERDNGNEAIR